MSPEEFLDFDQALVKLGVSDADLNRRIQNGEIKAYQIAGIRKLKVAEVESLKQKIESGSDSTLLETDIFGSADDVLDLTADENLDAELGLSFDDDVDETSQTIVAGGSKKPASTFSAGPKSDIDDTQAVSTQELSFDDSDDLEILPYESGDQMKRTVGFTVGSTDATHDDLTLQSDDEGIEKTTNISVTALESSLERTVIEQSGITSFDSGATQAATRVDRSATRSATAVSQKMRSSSVKIPQEEYVSREVQIKPLWAFLAIGASLILIWCFMIQLSFISGSHKSLADLYAQQQKPYAFKDVEVVSGYFSQELRTGVVSMAVGTESQPGFEAWGESPYDRAKSQFDKFPDRMEEDVAGEEVGDGDGEKKEKDEDASKDGEDDEKDADSKDGDKEDKKDEDKEEKKDDSKEENKDEAKDETKDEAKTEAAKDEED